MVSVTWRCDDFSEWNSWTEKMLAVGTLHLRVLWFLKIVTNYISKEYQRYVSFPVYTESISWHDRHMLICVAIIKSGVTMVCINKRSSDCAIFDVYIAMISMLRVYLFFVVRFFGLSLSQIYHICMQTLRTKISVYYCMNAENFWLSFFNGVR